MSDVNYKPYPSYRSSNIEWVSDIPDEWLEVPFFTQCVPNDSDNKGMTEDNLLSLSYGRIIRKNIETADGLLPASFETYQIVEKDNIVFRLTDLQNDKRSLRSAICTERGIITSAYLAVEPTAIDADYFAYLMRSYDHTKVFYAQGSGLRQSLKYSDMKRLPLLAPPRKEQKQIAAFLDYETAKIDALIEKQQQLIALLGEKRQAVISHAVTKGLNPDAPMRDSGVEWLGEVPAHWGVLRLNSMIETRKGIAFKSSDFIDDGIPVVKASDIKKLTIRTPSTYLSKEFLTNYPKAILKTDELVLSTVGSNPDVTKSAVGQIGKVPKKLDGCLLNQNTVVFCPNHKSLSNQYLYFLLQADCYRDHLDLHAHGTANQSSLSIVDMLRFSGPLPPLIEQEKIATQLLQSDETMVHLIEKSKSTVELLQERRTAVISAAVTGKIDVRNWKPPTDDNPQKTNKEAA